MNWQKQMGAKQEDLNSIPYMQKVQNIQKVEIKTQKKPFAPFAPIALNNQTIKFYKERHKCLWKKATALADWIDDNESGVPVKERAARVPEVMAMSVRLSELEELIG